MPNLLMPPPPVTTLADDPREAALIAEIQRRSNDWFRAGLYATSTLEAEKCRTAAAALAQLASDLQVA